MNAHKRHGYSHSDVADYALHHCAYNKPHRSECRLKLSAARLLTAANTHIIHAMRYTSPELTANGYYSREDHIAAARGYLRRATEWRNELRGERA